MIRKFAAMFAALLPALAAAQGEAWPSRPVTMVVPSACVVSSAVLMLSVLMSVPSGVASARTRFGGVLEGAGAARGSFGVGVSPAAGRDERGYRGASTYAVRAHLS